MSDFAWDWSIAGCNFLSANTPENPYSRGFARVSRQQVDTDKAPGEQSMDLWWLRSQSTFTGGAGTETFEPATDDLVRTQFSQSEGVDPWTDGEVKLLKRTASAQTATGIKWLETIQTLDGECYAFYSDNATIKRWKTTTGTMATKNLDSGGIVGDAAVVGDWLYFYDEGNYTLNVADYSTSAFISTPFDFGTHATSTSRVKLFSAKGRLFLSLSGATTGAYNQLFIIPPNWAGIDAEAAPPTPYFATDESIDFNGIAESGGAVLLSAQTGSGGAIYRITGDFSGPVPDLSAPAEVATFPHGEWPTGLFSYLGAFVVIGTNKGIRVGEVRDDGTLQYGPITVKTSATYLPVRHFAGRDRFVYAAVDRGGPTGNSGLVRIDLSAPDSSGRFAWANDATIGNTDLIVGLKPMGNQNRMMMATGTAVFAEHATEYVPSGWIQTGQILYGTLEPKVFRTVRTNAPAVPSGGSVAVASVTQTGTAATLATYTAPTAAEVTVSPATRVDRLGFRYTLTRGSSAFETPVLAGYAVKALPAVDQVELITIPVLCFDREMDKHNVKQGGPGTALARFSALKTAMQSAGVFTVASNATAETFTCVLSPDSIAYGGNPFKFTQTEPPSGFEGFGGVIEVTVRVV